MYCDNGIPVPRVLCHSLTEVTQVPGRYKNAVPVPLVFVARAYRAYRSSGYGYECRTELRSSGYGYERPTELTELPGTGTEVLQNSHKFRAGIEMLYPYP